MFIAVAFGTGAFGLFIGGLMEYRANNIFGGTFALFYSAFLLTTAIMLRVFAKEMEGPAFAAGFGTWLLLWCVFTFMLSWAAWHINMPAFLAFVLLALGYLLFGLANLSGSPETAAALEHDRRLGPHRRRFGCLVSELGARGQSGGWRQAAVVAVSLRCVLLCGRVGARTCLAPHRPGAYAAQPSVMDGRRRRGVKAAPPC